ncbi:tetratricopeptide repeat protein [Candidatus Daviesbacteria bacterium]|nr:tetratricopeptide repeat protein [Candidatus Daviesbacteria bacterium]
MQKHKNCFRNNYFKIASKVLAGLILSLITLEITLRTTGFLYILRREYYNRISLQKKADFTLLALGESTTEIGGESAWPNQLEQILSKRLPKKKFTVINKGKSGTNSFEILSALEKNLDIYKPDIVITMMGINDGAASNLKIYDETFSVNVRKPPYENHLPFYIDDLRIFKVFNLIRVLIKQRLKTAVFPFYNYAFAVEQDDNYYVGLGSQFQIQGKYEDAGKQYLKALQINPNNYKANIGLGDYYISQTIDSYGAHHTGNQIMEEKAENMYRKAIKIDPDNPLAYLKLGIQMHDTEKYLESENLLFKKIQLDKNDIEAHLELARTYSDEGSFNKSEEILKDLLPKHPDNKLVYDTLERMYRREGFESKADEVYQKVLGMNPALISNFRKLKQIILARGIKLVAVQYPTRKVEVLKNIVGTDNTIFVDNEKIFKDALNTGRYEDYFTDRFGGDFGHATQKGNFLLASNIADTLIKELFKN